MINLILLIIFLVIGWFTSIKIIAMSIINLTFVFDVENLIILCVSTMAFIVINKIFLTNVVMELI